ncbi:MAG: HAMP domain-containing protein [Candidatus Riflebacteria bacterium]|nr:HAMP domain-containing protein [Candidatus Riflebacteria bacterium]
MKTQTTKIRHKMLAIFSVTVLIGVFLSFVFVTFRLREIFSSNIVESQEKLVETIKQVVAVRFDDWYHQLKVLSDRSELQFDDKTNIRNMIWDFLSQNPVFLSCWVYDPQGNILLTANRNRSDSEERYIGKNMFLISLQDTLKECRRAFKAVLEKKIAVPATYMSNFTRGPRLVILQPVREIGNEEKLIKILGMSLNLDGGFLEELLLRFSKNENDFLLFADESGTIISRFGGNLPEKLSKAIIADPPHRKKVFSLWSELNSEKYLVTVAHLEELGGFLLIGHPAGKIFQPVNDLTWGMFFLALLFLLIAGLVGYFVADYIMEPVFQIFEGITKISDGVLTWRIEKITNDELGDVAKAFNGMADKLEKNKMIEELWNQRWNQPR